MRCRDALATPPTTGPIPFAFPSACPYNAGMDSQATVLCETEKRRWLIPCGRRFLVSRHGKCRRRKWTGPRFVPRFHRSLWSACMPWYKVTISAHQPDFYQRLKIQDEFEKIFIMLGHPAEIALFAAGWSHSDTFSIYFAPDCASYPAMKALMDECGAVPCDKPTRETEDELCLRVGAPGSWDVWCPDMP